MKFTDLLHNISQAHNELQAKAAQSVNQLLTVRNWCIGAYIVEYEQNGQDRAKYGTKLFSTLAQDLKAIKGLGSATHLKRFRTLYQTYKLFGSVIAQEQFLLSSPIRPSVMVELEKTENDEIEYIKLLFQRVSFYLPTEEELQDFILKELKKR